MREMRIPKGPGKWRVVYSPDGAEKQRYQSLLPVLQAAERAAARSVGTEDVAHGFVVGRSPVTCAMVHRGSAVTICTDLSGWFDSVRPAQVVAGLEMAGRSASEATELASRCCYKGAPRQGLPSSPTACNLAAVALDRAVLDGLARLCGERVRYSYTRYADDLTVSFSVGNLALVEAAQMLLRRCAEQMGWQVAAHKTRVQYASAGRRVVVGVSVGEDDVAAPRWQRRRLRAAQHQAPRSHQTRGLREWCAMKLPRAMCSGWSVASDAPALPESVVALASERGLDVGRADHRLVLADMLEDDGRDASAVRASLVPPK